MLSGVGFPVSGILLSEHRRRRPYDLLTRIAEHARTTPSEEQNSWRSLKFHARTDIDKVVL